jgi:hypothetical protein
MNRKAYEKTLFLFLSSYYRKPYNRIFLSFFSQAIGGGGEPYNHSFIKLLPEAVQPFYLFQAIAGSRTTIVTQAIYREPYNRVYYSQAIYREPYNRLLSIVYRR